MPPLNTLLPLSAIAKVKPIYQRLSEDSLLEKRLHGKTQNQKGALNGMIWNRIPKEVFVGRNLLEFGMFDAISHFNIGSKTIIQLFAQLNIPIGKYTEEGCRYMDTVFMVLSIKERMKAKRGGKCSEDRKGEKKT